MKRYWPFLVATSLIMVGCSNQDAPTPNAVGTKPASTDTPASLHRTAQDSILISDHAASLTFHRLSIDLDPKLNISVDLSGAKLELPDIAGVHSSFIMKDVKNASYLGAWNVQVVKPLDKRISSPISLTLNGLALLKATPGDVTEVFLKNNATQSVQIVGSFRGLSSLTLDNFGDDINDLQTENDLTYFAYRSKWSDYAAACIAEGGDVDLKYCSFRNKVLPSIQSLAPKSNLKVISWNIGNVAQSCGVSTGGANYNYKLCYSSSERRIADAILAFDQTRQPDIILFQEMWHGDCRYTPESTYGTYTNQRLCAFNAAPGSSIQHILGTQGQKYTWRCTQTSDVPADSLVVNGYECTAIAVNSFRFTNINAYTGDSSDLHPQCVTPDPAHNYMGRDTGYLITAIQRTSGSTVPLVTLINGHLVGINQATCRAAQITALKTNSTVTGAALRVFSGDWNTEPLSASDPGAATFRDTFAGPWAQPSSPIATIVDDPTQTTAYYAGGYSPSLDHVLSNSFAGSCSRGPNFDGTDHVWSNCLIQSAAFPF